MWGDGDESKSFHVPVTLLFFCLKLSKIGYIDITIINMSSKPIIVSGIQPTGNLHVGNYLGAVKNWVELQNSDKYEMYIFIADLHSLAGNMTAKERHEQIIRTSAELIASGIDPDKTTLFVQSHVAEHTELAWIFNTVTPISELERMTQFKDKSQQQLKNINTGLFTYPILQAADILLYGGQMVPVGQDQIQHVELTRDIAKKFNKKYSKYFPETKHLLTKIPKVMSLLEPEKKMSKSLGEGHVIELADEPNVIEKKLKKAVTASGGGEGAPGVENLLLLLKQFSSGDSYKDFEKAEKAGTIRYGDLKSEVGNAVAEYFAEFREKRNELMMNHDELAEILIAGADKANPVASKTMEEVRKLVGIR
jgi:tryptophanyl-tRNA synthetase